MEYIGSLDNEYDKKKLVSAYNTWSRNENVILKSVAIKRWW